MSEQIEAQLNRITAILMLAFDAEIAAARDAYKADKVTAEILDATQDWASSGALQTLVSQNATVSARTVRTRLGDLRDRGLILSRGAGSQTEYKNAGIL